MVLRILIIDELEKSAAIYAVSEVMEYLDPFWAAHLLNAIRGHLME